MKDVFQQHYDRLSQWLDKMVGAGWLEEQDATGLQQIERQEVERLFKEQKHRPLIVGFFGGTGVGKSSLLNRLAGEAVAKVGIERPTSYEMTLYLHEDYQIAQLPDDLPIDSIRIAYHRDDESKQVAWLDMPDIDSTALENRALVETWLPYLDWVIYVISPDRYYDDVGWRFLQARGQRHAWVFVMNHWDKGRPEQLDDLRQRLIQEGFESPVILTTSCTSSDADDDFPKLEQTIRLAIEEYGLKVLQQLGVQARLDDLNKNIGRFIQTLGSEQAWADGRSRWDTLVNKQLSGLADTLHGSAGILTQSLQTMDKGRGLRLPFIKSRDKETVPKQQPDVNALTHSLWTERSNGRLLDLDEKLLNQLQSAHLPIKPFKQALASAQSHVEERIQQAIEDELTQSLAQPGTPLQRFVFKLMDKLTVLLPLAAAAWAIFHVVGAYYAGTQGEAEFLGLNFAIHSGLLIGLAWFIPWLLKGRLKPSIASSAKLGLDKGIDLALQSTNDDYAGLWDALRQQQSQYLKALQKEKQDMAQVDSGSARMLSAYVHK